MQIRNARREDLCRIAEINVFNNRINFYPIFEDPSYSFGEMQVVPLIENYYGTDDVFPRLLVAERDGLILGFMELDGTEVVKLYVEPFFQSEGVGAALLDWAVRNRGADRLWALEKNTRAVAFYTRHGFTPNGERTLEEGTTEYLVRLVRQE